MTDDLDLRAFIRDIPDFPKPGIVFKDITPLLLEPRAYDYAVGALAEHEIAASRQQGQAPDPRSLRRATLTVRAQAGPLYRLADVVEETGAEASLVRELEDYGVIKGQRRDGDILYDDTEREIIRAVAELARFGVGGRNLRVFRTSADREAALLEQILAPALRSRNPERRREAVEALENLAATASHLKYLLLVRDLRRITS